MKDHHYKTTITWTGNTGAGTKDYRSYERAHTIAIEGKQDISGSSDPSFRGDKSCYSPEDLLLSSVSACHMLWYLHLCTTAGVVVTAYQDRAEGTMVETSDGGGYFTQVILKPLITLKDATMQAKADELHHEANKLCFIANSVKFSILHEAEYRVEG
ncbi:OsmC family protein [Mucilaginibacter sp. FT3.2]|uniref:OsmC family protein n=1 Tax=Mucilaginibacter sp. FT3.2 TaxID=2723090 RepID=UPI001611DE4C|nr:OsmC family protein [Mucilaginibacter sp. FT3.2]MBB6231479.1 organic hydroperoxide reductase OsmC/OhrA [Mucilaginibacter sp. FT3.2]